MNKVRGKIRILLREEFIERSISITEYELEKIVEFILSGNFAFRVIYDDMIMGDLHYIYEEHYPLEYNMIKYNGDLVSIDGGTRFQWNKREVFLIDKSLIREWKLNQIL